MTVYQLIGLVMVSPICFLVLVVWVLVTTRWTFLQASTPMGETGECVFCLFLTVLSSPVWLTWIWYRDKLPVVKEVP